MPELSETADCLSPSTKQTTTKPSSLASLTPEQLRAHKRVIQSNYRTRKRLRDGPRTAEQREVQRLRSAAYRVRHPATARAATNASGRKHYSKHRARKFLLKYGITIEQRDAIFAAQGFCCAICRSPTPNTTRGWQMDHDHIANEPRGVLCQRRNTDLAVLEDRTFRTNAEAYLERYNVIS